MKPAPSLYLFPIDRGEDLERWCKQENRAIHEIVMLNELSWRPAEKVRTDLMQIWEVMKQ
jgi:L-serine dehydratase